MHLPAYVPDQAVLDRLAAWGVEPVLPVRRRLLPGTHIADGTRCMRVCFPAGVVSPAL